MTLTRTSFVLGVFAAAISCQSAPATFTDAQKQEVVDSVTAGMRSYAAAIGSVQAERVTGHYVQGPEFRLTSDGKIYTRQDISDQIAGRAPNLSRIEAQWDSLAVTALAPDAAFVVAPFHRADVDRAGKISRVVGVATWVWVRRDGRWQMLYGHGDHYPDTTKAK